MVVFSILNLAKYLIEVPCCYHYQMSKKLSLGSFVYYICFNVVYGLVMIGVINLDFIKHLWQ